MSRHWAWLLSLGAHAALVLVLAGVGARMRRDPRAPAAQPETIEIDLIPGLIPGLTPEPPPGPTVPAGPPPGPASALARVPAGPPAVQPSPQRAPAPAQLSPPRRAPAPAQPSPTAPASVARAPLAAAPDTPAPPDSPGPPDAPAAAAGSLSMRSTARAPGPGEPARPRSPGVDLSPALAARMALPDPGPPPSSPLDLPGPPPEGPDVRDGWMPTGGGNYAVASPGFMASIARDGQVTIEDKPSFQFTPRLPGVGSDFSNEHTGQGGPQTFLRMDIATFDLTDWVMRMSGMDPYASAKLRLLDQTREVRAEMRARARIEDLRDAIAMLPRLLDTIWHEPGLPAAERRELLFRIWDECAEIGRAGPDGTTEPADRAAAVGPVDSGEPDEDDALARASRTARATVLGYIRRNLPAGSPDAYPAAEIEALNARRKSAQRFVPYP